MKRIKDGDQYLVELDLELKRETDLAYLLSDGDKDVWIPKSQIEDMIATAFDYQVIIPEWLAIEKELV